MQIESDQCFVIVVEAVFLPCVHTKHDKSVLQLVVICDIIVNINITCNLFIIKVKIDAHYDTFHVHVHVDLEPEVRRRKCSERNIKTHRT